MPRDDLRFAVAAREDGLRRVRGLTFRIGAAGLVCAAAIAVAFSHLSGSAAASSPARGSGTGQNAGGVAMNEIATCSTTPRNIANPRRLSRAW